MVGFGTNGGLKYTNFEDVLNNPRKVTCCATDVSTALWMAGVITEDDLTFNGYFNPNYQVHLQNLFEERDYETITDVNELQAGDIVFYAENGHTNHVEVYAGNNTWWNSGINLKELQSKEPIYRDAPYWYLHENWKAYRIPENDNKGTTLEEVMLENNELSDVVQTKNEEQEGETIKEEKENIPKEEPVEEQEQTKEVEDTKPTEPGVKDEEPKPEKENGKGENNKPTRNPNNGKKPTKPKPKPDKIPDIIGPETGELPTMNGTPEAIIKAAQNAGDTTNYKEYICDVLHNSGYLTEEEMNIYKDYSINELYEEFSKQGWEKITETGDLQVGDIIIVNTEEGETARIYAGNNSWYTEGETKLQQGEANWAENVTWVAYRPE